MFTDCIVRNRGAIAEPWREYRVEGNRYFIFQIVISICSMLIFGGLAVIYFVGSYMGHTIVPLALIILFGVAFVLIALLVTLIMKLMVPVMYRQRCTAMDAFRDLWQLIVANPGVFILFCLFYIVLFIAAADDRLPRRLCHLLHRSAALHRHGHPSPGRDGALRFPALLPPAIRRPVRCLGRR